MNTPEAIPIFVMSYNDLPSLRLCLRGIARRTHRRYRLIVVDNASTDRRLQRYLRLVERTTSIRVYRNRLNLWVLGLNRAVRENVKGVGHDDLFALTDCDIIVPPPAQGLCWLSRMERTLGTHACVGKLGLSLDLGYIKSRPAYAETYAAEAYFMQGPTIGELLVAPVDTTMALYRASLFVTRRPIFIPGHQSLSRAYYYTCRTPPSFVGKHLSWRFYRTRSPEDVTAKLLCFGMLGATAAPSFYRQAPWWARTAYRFMQPLARVLWGVAVTVLQTSYALRTLPRNANQLQASRRGFEP